jgi:uncharacterized membrane-anchored protein YjiN (DUF445 family)
MDAPTAPPAGGRDLAATPPESLSLNVAPRPSRSDAERAAQGLRLRAFATGLLVLMAALFLAATWATDAVHPGFAWVQAFAEAALVGGLADWFAVTALFRHPLGLPIPHTAIIPNSKDRIGDALAAFLQDNFLTPDLVARRLEGVSFALFLADFLERPQSGGRVRRGVLRLARQLAATPAAAAIATRVKTGTMDRLAEADIAPTLGSMLEAMVKEGRHRPVMDALIQWAGRTLDSQEALIRAMVEERTAWLLRLMNLDRRVADELLKGLKGLLADMATDPDHPVREKADRGLENLVFDLKHMPETQEKVERAKRELLAHPAVAEWLDGLWKRAGEGLVGLFEGEGAGELTLGMARALREDRRLADAVDSLVRRAILNIVNDHGDSLVALVSDTVKGWDAATVTDKVEGAVLKDLQYIRLNGTLIGGCIGLALHAVLVVAG